MRYFGPWDDPEVALQRYEDFLEGKPPETNAAGKAQAGSARPAKPRPDFPLFAHATGRWTKKIRGKIHYFGPWSDPDGALDLYLKQKDAQYVGRKPRPDPEEEQPAAVKDVANAFLTHKQKRVEAGRLTTHTFANYKTAADELVPHMGKTRIAEDLNPQDFAGLHDRMAAKWGLYCLGVSIQHIRSIFKYGFDSDLITRPVKFGPGFDPPRSQEIEIHKGQQAPNLFTAAEIRKFLDSAGVQSRAMLLLGVNGGFGNSDCAKLPLYAINLDTGWVNFSRPKTGVRRRFPLWPETVEALHQALAARPEPKDPADAGLVFLTKYGAPWARKSEGSRVSKETKKLLHELKINGRKGLGFYTLRHVFRTIADEAKDQPATDYIMGHKSNHMASHYRETISDERLRAVTDYVRTWLYPPAKKDPTPKGDEE
jgi:integrase